MPTFTERYGPWAVIVGASGGIGAAAAEEAARRGLNVVTVARREDVLERKAQELRANYGISVRTVSADMGEPHAVDMLTGVCRGLEVGTLIFNAAAEPRGAFLSTPVEDLLTNIVVNCTAPTLLMHHFGQQMAARRTGAIVLVSSMGALQGGAVFSAYFAAKAYEWILAEGLWAELADHGVDVMAYMVGATRTEAYVGQKDGSSDSSAKGADPTLDLDIDVASAAFDVALLRPAEPVGPRRRRPALAADAC